MTKKIRVIGDVHGKINKYLDILDKCQYSVQVGDLAFDYRFLDNVDSECHKWIPGNHCNYDKCFAYPHCLGNFGVHELNGIEFFYVRGEFSIDWAYRVRHQEFTGQKSWWKQEELTQEQMYQCRDYYNSVKPEFVITHGWPRSIANIFGNPSVLKDFGYEPESFTTNTQELLQTLLDDWKPKLWIGGHLHIRKETTIGETRFICLPELGYCDVDENLGVTRLYTN